MTKQEFEERTGMNVTPIDYINIEKIYMASTFGKDEFCQEWKKCKGSPLLKDLAEKVNTLEEEITEHKNHMESLGCFLADQASLYCSDELRKKAITLLGRGRYISYIISEDYKLTTEDKELIKNMANEYANMNE